MANTKSAKKQAKQNEKRRVINLARKSAIKTAIKKVVTAITAGKDNTQELLLSAVSQIARAKTKGVFHANTASRKISRLTKRLNKANAAA